MFCLLAILSFSAAKVETVAEGTNFTAINIGKLSDLNQHELVKDGKVFATGKVFVGKDAKMTGSDISYTTLPPGGQSPFFHVHHIHEEVYLVLSGSGEYQADDKVFPIEEGSIVRVGTGVSRSMKNTGKVPLVYICIQTTENSYQSGIPNEAEITKTTPKFTVNDEI